MPRIVALTLLAVLPFSFFGCDPPAPPEDIGFVLEPISTGADVRLTYQADGGVEEVLRNPETPWPGGNAADFVPFEAQLQTHGATAHGRLTISVDAGVLAIHATASSALPEYRKGEIASASASLGTFRVVVTGTSRDEVEVVANCRFTLDVIPTATAAFAEAEVTTPAAGRVCVYPEGLDGGLRLQARREAGVLGADPAGPEFRVEMQNEANTFGQPFDAHASATMELTFEVLPAAAAAE